jgi:membrane protease YdiL (CAAX protease family)
MNPLLAYSLSFAITGLFIVLLFSESFRKSVSNWFFESNLRPWALPVLIVLSYAAVTVLDNRWRLSDCFIIAVYFFIPLLLIWLKPARDSRAGLYDIVVLLAVWIPQELGLVKVHWIAIGRLEWPLTSFVTVMFVLVLLTRWRGMELWCPGKLKVIDIGAVALAYLILSAVILPIGMSVNFLLPGMNRVMTGYPGALVIGFLGILFAVAIPEELLFRGWIQNLLMTRMKFLPALLTSAVIFGLSHLDNKVVTSTRIFEIPDWWYGLLATFAGLAYGYIYHKRRSLLASALLHALVDFTWVLFFRG